MIVFHAPCFTAFHIKLVEGHFEQSYCNLSTEAFSPQTRYVYVLLCKDQSYYTGYAKNLERQLRQHRRSQGVRYTRMRKPEKIVYVEKLNGRGEAVKREREIKSLGHDEKCELACLLGYVESCAAVVTEKNEG